MAETATAQELDERPDDTAQEEPPPGGDTEARGEPPGPPGRTGLEERRRPGRSRRLVAAVVAAAVLVGGGYGLRAATSAGQSPTTTSSTSSTTTSSSQQTGDISSLVASAEKAIVKITSQMVRQTFFGQTATGQAVGTGFVVSSNGLILTNNHVVEAAQRITVTLNGRTYDARIVKANSSADLAVLKIDATGLSTLPLGQSSNVLAGQSVVAIGYALDLGGSPTVTTGIVSATGRTIQVQDDAAPTGPVVRTYSNVLQISAAINSGNSGGPLLDLQGRVIGIASAGAQGANNIGFAIPIDQAKTLIASAE